MIIETAIIVAIITGLFSVMGQYMIARVNKEKEDKERAVRDERTSMRLDQIEKKLDEHNSYAQRFSETAERLARVEQKLEDM